MCSGCNVRCPDCLRLPRENVAKLQNKQQTWIAPSTSYHLVGICVSPFCLRQQLICQTIFPESVSTFSFRGGFAPRRRWKNQHRLGRIIPIVLVWMTSLWVATELTRLKSELCCSARLPPPPTRPTPFQSRPQTETNWLADSLPFRMASPHRSRHDPNEKGQLWAWKEVNHAVLSILLPPNSNMTNSLQEMLGRRK